MRTIALWDIYDGLPSTMNDRKTIFVRYSSDTQTKCKSIPYLNLHSRGSNPAPGVLCVNKVQIRQLVFSFRREHNYGYMRLDTDILFRIMDSGT
jgi:hypothetical protein